MSSVYEAVRDNSRKFVAILETPGAIAHFHNAVELLILNNGRIELGLNGKTSFLNKGHIVLCNSYDIHSFKIIEKNTVGNVVIIPKSILSEYYIGIKNKKFSENIIADAECFTQANFLYALISEQIKKKNQDLYLINSLAQSLFALIASKLPLSEKPNSESEMMKDVLFYLYENYTENITLASIAKHFGYTKNYFSNIFCSYMQISLTTFINNLRVEKSAALIKKGKSISAAALDAGFLSLRTFYRCFKEAYGVSPAKYKYS